MTSDSANSLSLTAPGDRPLLIEPAARRRFVLLYVVATIAAWLVARYLWPVATQIVPLERSVQGVMQGFLTGATVGFGQWWVLRRYIPTWQWIAANALGQLAIALGSVLWQQHLLALAQQNPDNFLETFGNNYAMPWPLSFPLSLAPVIFQWLVLRRYLSRAYGWFLIPLVVTGVSLVVFLVTGLLGGIPSVPLRVSLPILVPAIGGTVQAIAFCLFRGKRGVPLGEQEDATKSLALKPLLRLAALVLLGSLALSVIVGTAQRWIEQVQMR